MININYFGLSGLLTGIASISFGVFVLLMGPNRNIGKVWFLFSLAVGVWGFDGMLIGCSKTAEQALLAWRSSYAFGVLWIAPLFYHFVCTFLELRRNRSIGIQYGVTLIFFFTIPTSLFFSRVRWIFDSLYYAHGGVLYSIYFIWWISLVVYSHYELIRAYHTASPGRKNQIKYFFVATAIGYSGGSFAYFPAFGIDVYPWGNFTVCLYPLLMTYAIMKHNLMNITVIIRKTLIYSVVTGTLVGSYFGIVALFARISQGFAGNETTYSSAIAAALITVFFQPLRKKVQSLVDTKFFRQYVDREEKLYELSRDVVTHTTPEGMARALSHVLNETLHPKGGALYLRVRDGAGYAPTSGWGTSSLEPLPEDHPLVKYFAVHPQPFILDEPSDTAASQSTRNAGAKRRAA